jgi:hypothetical protein
MDRKIRSLQDSKEIIEPFHSELVQCIEKGFNDFMKVRVCNKINHSLAGFIT